MDFVIPPVPARDLEAPGQTERLEYQRPRDRGVVSDTIIVSFVNVAGDSLFFQRCAADGPILNYHYRRIVPDTGSHPYFDGGLCFEGTEPRVVKPEGQFVDTIPVWLESSVRGDELARQGTGVFRILYRAYASRGAASRLVLDPPVPDSLRWTNRFLIR